MQSSHASLLYGWRAECSQMAMSPEGVPKLSTTHLSAQPRVPISVYYCAPPLFLIYKFIFSWEIWLWQCREISLLQYGTHMGKKPQRGGSLPVLMQKRSQCMSSAETSAGNRSCLTVASMDFAVRAGLLEASSLQTLLELKWRSKGKKEEAAEKGNPHIILALTLALPLFQLEDGGNNELIAISAIWHLTMGHGNT